MRCPHLHPEVSRWWRVDDAYPTWVFADKGQHLAGNFTESQQLNNYVLKFINLLLRVFAKTTNYHSLQQLNLTLGNVNCTLVLSARTVKLHWTWSVKFQRLQWDHMQTTSARIRAISCPPISCLYLRIMSVLFYRSIPSSDFSSFPIPSIDGKSFLWFRYFAIISATTLDCRRRRALNVVRCDMPPMLCYLQRLAVFRTKRHTPRLRGRTWPKRRWGGKRCHAAVFSSSWLLLLLHAATSWPSTPSYSTFRLCLDKLCSSILWWFYLGLGPPLHELFFDEWNDWISFL